MYMYISFPFAISVIMNADERLKKLKEIIQKFPKYNLATFKHLMMHLKRYVIKACLVCLCLEYTDTIFKNAVTRIKLEKQRLIMTQDRSLHRKETSLLLVWTVRDAALVIQSKNSLE